MPSAARWTLVSSARRMISEMSAPLMPPITGRIFR